MKTYFYVIEWPNGRKESVIVEAQNAQDAFTDAQHACSSTQPTNYGGRIVQVAGVLVAFNKVDDE